MNPEKDDIKVFIPEGLTIPTVLAVTVGNHYIEYQQIDDDGKYGKFIFDTSIDDEEEALEVVSNIVDRIISEHNSTDSTLLETELLEVIHNERYSYGATDIVWAYKITDKH